MNLGRKIILITGSTDGVGHVVAQKLVDSVPISSCMDAITNEGSAYAMMFLTLVAALCAVVYFMSDLAVTVILGCLANAVWASYVSMSTKFDSTPLYKAIRLAPAFLTTAFLFGSLEGHVVLNDMGRTIYFIKSKEESAKRPVFMKRSIDRGVLVLDPVVHQISFYRWEDVEIIRKWSFPDNRRISCKWFGWWCPASEPLL